MAEKTLTIYTKEKKSRDGKIFRVSNYLAPNGKWYDVKFTAKCGVYPVNNGFNDVKLNTKDISIQHKKINDVEKNIIWVRKVTEIVENTEKNKELEQKRNAEIDDLFLF